MTLIKSISGIRGTIGGRPGDNLTPLDIVKFTTAYVRFLGERKQGRLRIVVGRDARLSGEMVGDLIEGALLGCGADVVNVGLCTTPGVELAVTAHEADGGIIITASHNPRQWNALKLLDADGEFLSDAEGKRVLELAERSDFEFPEVDALGHVLSRESFNDEHIRRVLALPLVDVDAVRRKRFKVVVDAVNSVGGIVIPKLLRELGCEVVELNCEPTGEFAHNPEPLPENLTEIAAAVVRYPAYYASKNKIALTPAIDVDKVLREIKDRYAGEQVNDIDGVKIDFAENWVHLRKSNTEPIIRVYTEARSMAEADALAQRFIGELREICNL